MTNFRNGWFNNRQSIKTLPKECVNDCTGPGPADEAVAYWVKKLDFDGPAWLIRDFLGDYGCWSTKQLCDHQENLQRLLWIWAGNIAEDPDAYEDLYLGV